MQHKAEIDEMAGSLPEKRGPGTDIVLHLLKAWSAVLLPRESELGTDERWSAAQPVPSVVAWRRPVGEGLRPGLRLVAGWASAEPWPCWPPL